MVARPMKKDQPSISVKEPAAIYYEQKQRQLRNLWLKVIIRAISDYVLYRKSTDPKLKREASTARAFLFDDDSGLQGICETFGLNIDVLRHMARTKTPSEIHKLEHLEHRRSRLMEQVLSSGNDGDDE